MRRERSPRCAVDGLKADSHWSWTAAAVHGTCILYSTVVPPARTTCGNLHASGSSGLWALASRLLTTASQITRPTSPLSRFAGLCLSGPHFQRVAWQKAEEVANQIGTDRDANLGGSATIDIRQTQDKRREEILSRRDPWMGWDGMVGTRRDEMR